MISAVGIKRILFADIDKVTADIAPEIAKDLIQAAIKAKDEVLNVHGETWQIEETEASVTGYKNQLTGKNYRYDDVPGEVSPAFSIGQYDWKTKKAFMGGDVIQATSKDVGWKRALDKVIINKALFCLTDDDVWFIFPKCRIVSREANTDKAIAIAVKGLVQEPGIEGVSSEYNYEEGQIKALQAWTTVTIVPTPSDATVKLDGVTVKSKQVNAGATVHYEVSKAGYVTQSGDIKTTPSEVDTTLKKEITLVKAQE